MKQCENIVALKLDQGVLDQEVVSDNGQQPAVSVLQGDRETVAGAAITRWTAQP